METSKRLISLDAFRGITIILMTLVNNAGSWDYVYAPLRHAKWHGCTPTDLVFPFFLFIMGTAMAFSFSRRLQEAPNRWPIYRQIIKRTLILIFLGFFLSFFMNWNLSGLRFPGVLQRIGLCYLFASLIILHFNRRGQIIWTISLLFGYWGIMTLIPFPGSGDPWAFGSNIAQYFDHLILKNHVYIKATQTTPGFDPEGLISTIPAIAQTLLGYFTGVFIRSQRQPLEKTTGMFIAASLSLLVAIIWEQVMPLNKQLWTSSYVLYTTGLALIFLAISYWLIDIKGYTRGTKPFVIFGSNAIIAYFGSSVLAKLLAYWHIEPNLSVKGFIYGSILQPIAGNWGGSLIYPFLHIFLWLGILTWMYRKKIFFKI